MGLVPAVEYKGKALYQSIILCEFLEDAYSSYQPNILPADPYTKAYVRIWVDYVVKNLIPGFKRLVQAQDPEKRKQSLDELLASQRKLAEQREDAGEAWKKYADNVAKRPSVINTSSDPEHYEEMYGLDDKLGAQSKAAKAIRARREDIM
ncbi:hypothetical protein EUX98_g3966 [Antrodiella citrinella]|uniref:GST N-terminal domain-containing protein n=1 Tax=Antrodiella citrinella TaxID=2447956 RepID=A0A4S4MVA4_9APHY|nr:hypothetical protein EUX98_g3966 [Antrodiella citrinella]